ncbi:MAG: 4Fe-4S dicluster domain-containing protein, partial [Phycisphaerae bacterium]|nr:4Fe-4S dicluster domain-containing protein [Phycisphaerae bacterium]
MQAHVLPKTRVAELVDALAKERRVVGPTAKENAFVFADLADGGELRLDYPISAQSPKKFFFPPYETLLKFHRNQPDTGEAAPDGQPIAILGMHPCDITSTWLLDKVFDTKNKDPYYQSRRERALIVGMDCGCPCDEHQFCLDMGSLYPKKGYDLFCQDLGDRFYVTVGTPAGQAVIDSTRLFTAATPADLLAHEEFEAAKTERFTRKLPFSADRIPELLGESYDSLIWDAVARRCFSCGSCNLVCPTCYCFNVSDELAMNLQDGERRRRWDGCQLRDFAEVAGGENFRPQTSQRLRHRVFRKGKYMKEQFGESGCVGCGRCDRHCVASISIRSTFQQLWEHQMAKLSQQRCELHPTPINQPASQYLPRPGRIVAAADFTEREKWFRVRLDDGQGLNFLPGQFVEISLFGLGEAPISICSATRGTGEFEMCVRSVGDVTNQLRKFNAGDIIGVRGPFG